MTRFFDSLRRGAKSTAPFYSTVTIFYSTVIILYIFISRMSSFITLSF